MKSDRLAFFRSTMTGIEAMAADTARAFPLHCHDVFGIGLIDRGAQRFGVTPGAYAKTIGRVVA